ncbi:hypothetical protein [Nocardia sp. NPDC050406]|uniref:DUF7373 family lipoprotein n=1 Tax=Nocardia sp. NPDC050406 TaxID=3364318 RepID=UPI0037A2AE50
MTRASRLLLALLAGAVAAGLTACGVEGTAVPGEIDVRTLDVGEYPVDKHNYPQNSGGNGALLEGMRMSEVVPPGVRVDPVLKVGRTGHVCLDPQDAENDFLAVGSGPVLRRNGMVIGYGASSADIPDPEGSDFPSDTATSITELVIRFPSESAAKVAARELEDVDFAYAPDQNRRLNLTEHPDAYIHWRPTVANIGTFMPYRQFVISLFIGRPNSDATDLLNWVRKTLDATVAALDAFTPTPADKLDSLTVDPDRMLARVITADRENRTPDPDTFAVYGPTGFIHGATDQPLVNRLLTDSGVDRVATVDGNTVMRARDSGAATTLMADLSTHLVDYDPFAAPKDVPGAKCFERADAAWYRCFVTYGRYVGIVDSDSESDVRQKIAAQYALFANSL